MADDRRKDESRTVGPRRNGRQCVPADSRMITIDSENAGGGKTPPPAETHPRVNQVNLFAEHGITGIAT